MLPLAHIGLSSSGRAGLRAAVVVLAWLALWFSVLVAVLEHPQTAPEGRRQIEVFASRQP
jgi:hypothetical protein